VALYAEMTDAEHVAKEIRTWCATANLTVTADEVYVSIHGMGPAVPLTAAVALAAFRRENPMWERACEVEPDVAAAGAADAVEQVREDERARVMALLVSAETGRKAELADFMSARQRDTDLSTAVAEASRRRGFDKAAQSD